MAHRTVPIFVALRGFVEEDSNAAKAEIQAIETHYVHFALASGNLHRCLDYPFTPRLYVNSHNEIKGQWLARKSTVTLLFAAKDTEYNNAVALKEHLEQFT